MIDFIGEILGRVYVFLMFSFYIAIIVLIPILAFYFLSKILIQLISKYKNSSHDNDEKSFPFLKTKITIIVLGIIYSIIILSGIALMLFEPSWFQPPVWLIIFSVIIFVPYFACVFGFIGLGNIGRSGFSPWRDFKVLLNDIKVLLK